LLLDANISAPETSGPPPVDHPPPSSKASRPPPMGSCPATGVEPPSSPVIESETLIEDVLRPLEQALEDCHGHTKVGPGTLGGGKDFYPTKYGF
jgi:hypothetical protein